MTPTLPGIEITVGDGIEVNDRDVEEAMDESDDEAEDCIVVANEPVAADDTVKDTEDAVGVIVDKLVGSAVEATHNHIHVTVKILQCLLLAIPKTLQSLST